jgi:hypothetical protein
MYEWLVEIVLVYHSMRSKVRIGAGQQAERADYDLEE